MGSVTPVQAMVTHAFRGSFFSKFSKPKIFKKMSVFSENFENFQYFQKYIITTF